MQNFLNAIICWRKQNFGNYPMWRVFDVLSESLFGFVSYGVF